MEPPCPFRRVSWLLRSVVPFLAFTFSGVLLPFQLRQGTYPAIFLPGGLLSRYDKGMVLSIKDPQTDRLARELAAATGETITVAIRTAVQERLTRTRKSEQRQGRYQALYQKYIVPARARRAQLDPRTPEEILGYGENGLPV